MTATRGEPPTTPGSATPPPGRPPRDADELEADELHDAEDRDELRDRYYGLLQEVRVVVTGVQVLLAFLLSVPFADRFVEIDGAGRTVYGIALVAALCAVVCLLAPTVLHHVGQRTARSARLVWSVRMTMTGLGLLAVAMSSAVWSVTRFVFAPWVSHAMTGAAIALALVVLLVIPRRLRPNRREHRPR